MPFPLLQLWRVLLPQKMAAYVLHVLYFFGQFKITYKLICVEVNIPHRHWLVNPLTGQSYVRYLYLKISHHVFNSFVYLKIVNASISHAITCFHAENHFPIGKLLSYDGMSTSL